MHTLRTTLLILSLFGGLSFLRAQHTSRLDSLGISADFPCESEKGVTKATLGGVEQYFYSCKGDDRSIYMLSLMILPESQVKAQTPQERMEAKMRRYTTPEQTSYKHIQATENSAEMELHYTDTDFGEIPMRVRVIYRAPRLLEIRYSAPSGKVNEEAWKRFSQSLKADW